MMLLLGIPKILLKLSFCVFYHGVLVLVSQSSLNSIPPALIPQHAVCFTMALFGLYHTQFPSLQPKTGQVAVTDHFIGLNQAPAPEAEAQTSAGSMHNQVSPNAGISSC